MPTFDNHITQAKNNLLFLEEINDKIEGYFDWKVTICFYVAVHLINAHLSKYKLQYRSHADVKHAINPQNTLSISKLPEDEYASFVTLQNLSRRSRYLVSTKDNKLNSENGVLTYDKHFIKALKHLDRLLVFFNSKYDLKLKCIKVNCIGLKATDLKFLEVI